MKRFLIVFISFFATFSFAATFTVTTTNDTGAGSLRQAILDANANVGVTNTIAFNITNPPSGVRTITLASVFDQIVNPVIIDGYTQSGTSPNTLSNADNAVLLIEVAGEPTAGGGLTINAFGSGSTIRGLVINHFSDGIDLFASNSVVEGNFLGTDPSGTLSRTNSGHGIQISGDNNLIGGTNAAARNIMSGNGLMGIFAGGSSSNVIQGNFVGVDATGTNALGNGSEGIRIVSGGSGNLVGGTNAAARNIVSGNVNDGVTVFTSDNVVQGNFIGTDVTGTKPLGNADGVQLSGNGNNSAISNVVSASRQHGVIVDSPETNAVVQGNFIGTDVTGTNALGNAFDGVAIGSANGATIGGTNAGAGNIIAYNGVIGVDVFFDVATNNAILGNSIFANGALGIDLHARDGVTPNDPGDADGGPNLLQNFPVITSAVTGSGTVTLGGLLDSTPSTQFRLEFFANKTCDDSGFGEGEQFLGFTNVTTTANGTNNFSVTFNAVPIGPVFAATATDPNGNTSEFSADFPGNLCVPDIECSLVPEIATNEVGGVHSVTLTVTSNGVAAAGAQVAFAITSGPNNTAPDDIGTITDGAGQAVFLYNDTGGAGTDTIRGIGTVGSISTTCIATKVWVAIDTNVPPAITCPGDIVTTNASGQCSRSVSFTATATGTPTPTITCTTNGVAVSSPVTFPVGATTVSCTASNIAGTDTCPFTVTVNDTEKPSVTCSGNIVTNVAAGVTNAVVTFDAPTVDDNCGIASSGCLPASGSTFALGINTVTCSAVDTSGNSNACSFSVIVQEASSEKHDLAVIRLHVPPNINLKAAVPALTKRVTVQIQNLSAHNETVSNLTVLANLVSVTLSNLHTSCPPPAAVLIGGPPNVVPKTLKPNGKLNVFFNVTFSTNCVPDAAKGGGHEDFSYTATVNHAALDGNADTVPSNDTCPRPPNPSIGDKGCGNKDTVTRQLGAPVRTDVVLKP